MSLCISRLDIYFLPVAASVTLSLPSAMSLTVARISEKSLNVVKGTCSVSQYVTRSGSQRGAGDGRSRHTTSGLGKEQVRLLCGRQVRDAIAGVKEDRPLALGEVGVWANLQGLVMAKAAAPR